MGDMLYIVKKLIARIKQLFMIVIYNIGMTVVKKGIK